jgi:predicted transcriptional regulator
MTYDIGSIKKIRKQLGMTQTEFAREAGVSQSLIAKIEAGSIDPTYSKVQQIFDAIDRQSKNRELSAKDIMQTNIITAKPGDKVVDIVKVMNKHAVSQIPVVEGKQMIGLITEKEVLEMISKGDIQELKAKDVMSDPPPIVGEDTKMSALSALIRYYPIIIVAKKGELAGVITKSDIINKMV